MTLKAVLAALIVVAGLGVVIWVANWPFNMSWAKDLTAEQRQINAAHNRRHHRAATRVVLPILAIVFGVTSASLLSGPKSDPLAAVIMGASSILCAGTFAVLVKRGRTRSATRR
ncbi:hypothetical protein ACQPZK_23675 [Micromonospora sp. CA-249363]|uniref:hypothetical protein n=1 Tax=Micromonospora sp. CA-249363 TaxID=3239963 RepID=UPI003D8FE742